MAPTEENELKESITLYETQLEAVKQALITAEEEHRADLEKLQRDITELISLTRSSLLTLQQKTLGEEEYHNQGVKTEDSSTSDSSKGNSLDEEFALFQAEISSLEREQGEKISPDVECEHSQQEQARNNLLNIADELAALEGMKCRAPYRHDWEKIGYHNAIIFQVEPLEDVDKMEQIQVRVVFSNPISQNMLACPYFLDNRCHFSDDDCRYSHGEVVRLVDLQEFREPKFCEVKPSVMVLAKSTDGVWYRAVVLDEVEGTTYHIKFESSKKTAVMELQDIVPLEGDDDEDEDFRETDEEEASEDEDMSFSVDKAEESANNEDTIAADPVLVAAALLHIPANQPMGEWEKYTKGIGSKLMASMGYIMGSGLGKHGEGRLDPVEATVFPPGKSLDHCMALKEKAGGADLLRVEKKLKRQQKKAEERLQRQYEKEKEQTSLFNFINQKLGGVKGNVESTQGPAVTKTGFQTNRKNLQTESSKGLNIQSLHVSQEILRTRRELDRLKEALERNEKKDASTADQIRIRLQKKEGELCQLQASEKNIQNEQLVRKDRKKLAVF